MACDVFPQATERAPQASIVLRRLHPWSDISFARNRGANVATHQIYFITYGNTHFPANRCLPTWHHFGRNRVPGGNDCQLGLEISGPRVHASFKMKIPFAGWVTACIPHYGCQQYIRRAVESLLSQSYPWIRVIVINDADLIPPWRELAHISDPRLFRFNLSSNAGPYFCLEVARRATPDPYFLIQDADDYSAPNRVERLIGALQRDESDLAVSAQPQVLETEQRAQIVELRWVNSSYQPDAGPFIVHHALTSAHKYRAPHHGLFRSSSLGAIGGYYGGLRINYDTLVPNLILMIGRISHVPEPLYYRVIRSDSFNSFPTHGRAVGERKMGVGNAARIVPLLLFVLPFILLRANYQVSVMRFNPTCL